MPPLLRSLSPARILLALVATALLGAELVPALFGLGQAPHRQIFMMAMLEPMLASAMAGSLACYFFLLPPRRSEIALIAIVGVLLDCWLSMHRAAFIGPAGRLLHLGMGPGLAALAVMAFRALRGPDRLKAEEALALGVALPGMLIFGAFAQSAIISSNPMVYDFTAYAFDAMTGVQPSFVVSHLASATRPGRVLFYVVYFQLPLWMILAQALVARDPKGVRSDPWIAFVLIGACGATLYSYFPVVGSLALCGAAWPDGAWPPVPQTLHVVAAPLDLPRNGMPSLHLAWILTAWWSVGGLAPVIRRIGAVLVFITIISTFSVGHHFLIDLVIAVPFALAAYAASLRSSAVPSGLRIGSILFGVAATMGWLTMMRYNPLPALNHPSWTMAGLALTDLASLALVARLGRSPLRAASPATPPTEDEPASRAARALPVAS